MIRYSIPSRQKRVVIDIDTQRCFFDGNGKTGIHNNKTVLANIQRVIAWTRSKHIPVVSTMQMPSNNAYCCNFQGADASDFEKIDCTLRNRRTLFNASDCTDLPIEILERYDQVIFCKRHIDPFEEPRADRMLSELKIDEFILIGSLAEGAIKATALGLLARHKNVRVLVDAIVSNIRFEANLALRHMLAKGAKLTKTQAFLGSLSIRSTRV